MEYIELSNIADIVSGYAIPSADMVEEGIPIIKITNIKEDGSLDLENTAKYNKPITPKLSKFLLKDKDVVVCMTGATIGKVARIIKVDQKYIVNQRVCIIRAKNFKLQDFVYHTLTIPAFRKYVEIVGYGAAQPNISATSIGKYKIKLFGDLPIQQKIASILSTYDNLIENNTKRIKLLEQMAENLYKEWFVRFRFPGHENTPMENSKLGKIPSSFSVKTMDSVIEYYIGGGWGNDDYSDNYPIQASVIRGTDFPSITNYDISTCPSRFHKVSNYKSRQLQSGDVILEISGGTAEQPVGRTVLITKELINRFDDGKLICASFCKLVRLNQKIVSSYYFYYWMQYLYDTRIIDRYQLQSTGIINFKFEFFLKNGMILLPSADLMKSFDDFVIPIFKDINSLAIQNQCLKQQRDLLLPRLMSGKLEVTP